ncbi:hypothetical protein BJ741DRAFT_706827 [Chytriomyces cf. hyalinus JEL632]|nr:hypothetical protein BJ741DRAFT_706827 [Chytriomyces cf. hyalinus JEL632]
MFSRRIIASLRASTLPVRLPSKLTSTQHRYFALHRQSTMPNSHASTQLNVYGEPMSTCCTNPMTGFFRTGSCETDEENDVGIHTVCVRITSAFLDHQKELDNDLKTPRKEFGFPGLKDGDRWCVCARRWKQSIDDGVVAKVILQSTHIKTLRVLGMSVQDLQQYSE